MTDEVHIASFVIQAAPHEFLDVCAELTRQHWLDCPLTDEHISKLIVLLECDSTKEMDKKIAWIKGVSGVLSVTMVYHQVEPVAHLQQEVVAWA